jgi:hypothetical protein
MTENVKASEPRENGKSREEKKEDGPSEEVVLTAA